ncbi:MAG: hypothetical protein AN487_16885 [Anabaena sp. CRKS33]|jgi:hypothetical protein|nr:MAG: hypothetical protein AN487_16885 [Anabaena sp. CRKS33]
MISPVNYSSSRYSQGTDINDKTLVVRASCPHKVYLTQSELAVIRGIIGVKSELSIKNFQLKILAIIIPN